MTDSVLSVKNAHVQIGEKTIIEGCDLEVKAGELVAVIGPNGAGKSTLVRAAAGMQKLTSGSVAWQGTDLGDLRGRKLARTRAFVPQNARVPAGVKVREAVTIGRSPHIGPMRGPGRHDHEAIERAMLRGGIFDLADRFLNTLSGGELQRVQLAVALAQEAPALIADEPTAHLDLGATSMMAGLMRSLANEGLAVVLVVHDLALAAAVSDRVVVLSRGKTVANGPAREVLDAELLAEVWHVDAELESTTDGRTALHVHWLGTLSNRTSPQKIEELVR